MADQVLPSIETVSNPISANGSVLSDLSDETYVEEEGTPEPHEPEARLNWGRKHIGEGRYQEALASREAFRKRRYEEEERERIEDEKVEEIRKLLTTDPMEYIRRMREYNLALQGPKKQIDKSNQPLTERNWEGFSDLQGKILQPATTNGRADSRSESMEVSQPRASLRLQKPKKEVSRRIPIAKSTARAGTVSSDNRSKRPAPTLAGALVDEKSASNATNVKAPRSKHDQGYNGKRSSRRLANKPVEYGIFASRSIAPVPKDLQRNPSLRKHNAAGPRSKKRSIAVKPAKHQGGLKSG